MLLYFSIHCALFIGVLVVMKHQLSSNFDFFSPDFSRKHKAVPGNVMTVVGDGASSSSIYIHVSPFHVTASVPAFEPA